MSSPRLTLVIPCFDEAKRLDLGGFADFLGKQAQFDFLFVDDGSRDETAALLEEFCTSHERARLHRLRRNRGKAVAVRSGLLLALEGRAGAVGYFDADSSTPLRLLPAMARELHEARCDAVLGARLPRPGAKIRRLPHRRLLAAILALAVRPLLGLHVRDTQCGAKLFAATPRLRAALAEPFLSRWLFDVELLARLARPDIAGERAALREHPLEEWTEQGGSKLRLRDYLRAPFDLLRIARTTRRLPPPPRRAEASSAARRAPRPEASQEGAAS